MRDLRENALFFTISREALLQLLKCLRGARESLRHNTLSVSSVVVTSISLHNITRLRLTFIKTHGIAPNSREGRTNLPLEFISTNDTQKPCGTADTRANWF